MEPLVITQLVSHSDSVVASRIHAVQMRAYVQEAQLLGALHFPPLERTAKDIQNSEETFLGAFRGGELVGTLSYRPDEEGLGTNIASLVVDLPFQRLGIGSQLLDAFFKLQTGDVTIQTGTRNLPALAMYARYGFAEYRRWFVGREPLELVKLRRSA